jgi:hypothetical protein
MSKNITDNNLVSDAKSVLKFWEDHPEINLNETTAAQFRKAQSAFQKITDEIAHEEIELSAKMTERDQLAKSVRVSISRVRSGVRAYFGPDSKEYEQVGGTRSSTKKRRVRHTDSNGATKVDGNGNSNGNGNGQPEMHVETRLA